MKELEKGAGIVKLVVIHTEHQLSSARMSGGSTSKEAIWRRMKKLGTSGYPKGMKPSASSSLRCWVEAEIFSARSRNDDEGLAAPNARRSDAEIVEKGQPDPL